LGFLAVVVQLESFFYIFIMTKETYLILQLDELHLQGDGK
jgi:hypothetical protein